MAEIMLRQRMYGTHPYGKSAFITKKSLQAIQQEDLQTFWRQHYRAAAAVVSIVGDINRPAAEKLVNDLLKDLPTSKAVLPAIPEVTPQAAAAPLQLLRPGSQTHIAWACRY
jgi:zinc protease